MSNPIPTIELPPIRTLLQDEAEKPGAIANLDVKLATQREKLEPLVGAFCADRDLPVAQPGWLRSVPFSVKDQFHIKGTKLGFGFGSPRATPSATTNPALQNLLDAGAHFIGRTNMPPLALDLQCVDGAGRRTNNPINPDYTSGGSSGGGAAAVASGMSLVDIGADLSGSLRVPAAFCGVFSFLASEGKFSNQGMFLDDHAKLKHFARPGPLARNVDDLWMAYSAMAGASAQPDPLPKISMDQVTIGVWSQSVAHPLDEALNASLQNWIEGQVRHGARVQSYSFDLFDVALRHDFAMLMGHETGALLPWPLRVLTRMFGRGAAQRSPDFLAYIHKGYGRSPKAYEKGLARRQDYIAAALAAFNGADIVLAPVCPLGAFKHIEPFKDQNGIRDYDHKFCVNGMSIPYYDCLTYYTAPVSLLGFPVVTVPIGKDEHGMPVGAQLIGKPNTDLQLLAVAQALFK